MEKYPRHTLESQAGDDRLHSRVTVGNSSPVAPLLGTTASTNLLVSSGTSLPENMTTGVSGVTRLIAEARW
ncbi:MAG TPA: hypothetical protein VK302_22230, partial [Terriglobales bacterium]|nr:hypothetical protein [Terriglobales bacterium]